MLSPFRRRTTAPQAAQRPPRVLTVEALEDRSVPSSTAALPDIAIHSVRLESQTVVRFDYQVKGNPGPFQVGLYRSADPAFDPGDERIGDLETVTPSGGGVRTGRLELESALPIDPARKFVFVVADPDGLIAERDEGNNDASFRKLVVGAVAHGLSLTGAAPPWLYLTTGALAGQGYDVAVSFDWAQLSQLPLSGVTVFAGEALAGEVRQAARAVATQSNDVVDVHLIGHSRGTAVISQAFLSLGQSPGPRALWHGYSKMTLLDPHVARNHGTLAEGLLELSANTGVSHVGQFAYDPTSDFARAAAVATLTFQAVAKDPLPFVPATVNEAEVFYQRLLWEETVEGSPDRELGINLWSERPEDIATYSESLVFSSLDVGAFGVGHFSVPYWYLESVLLPAI